MKVDVNQLVIPKATPAATAALNLVNQNEPDIRKLEKAIMQDPILASTLLRYANSPLVRRATEVTSVPSALKLLGLNSVKSAVVTATIRSLLPKDNLAGQCILTHMIEISMLCKLIAKQVCQPSSDELEFLGLVHDVGVLTLISNFDLRYSTLFARALKEGIELDVLEKEEFGISHDIVSSKMAHEFRLPKLHVELLHNFHPRDPITEVNCKKDRDTCILALSHKLEYEYSKHNKTKETVNETTDVLAKLLSIDEEQLTELRTKAQDILERFTPL